MRLFKLTQLKSEIDILKSQMNNMAEKSGFRDPQVLKISQELDTKIVVLQRLILKEVGGLNVNRI